MATLLKMPLPGTKELKEAASKRVSGAAKDHELRWRSNHASNQEPSMAFNDTKTELMVDLAKRYRDRGFVVEDVIVECSIRHKATWDEVISAWAQAGLIEGNVDFAKWKRANPNDAQWLFGE